MDTIDSMDTNMEGTNTNNVQNLLHVLCKTVYPIAGNGVQTNDTIHNVVLVGHLIYAH